MNLDYIYNYAALCNTIKTGCTITKSLKKYRLITRDVPFEDLVYIHDCYQQGMNSRMISDLTGYSAS